jgi:adenylate cyclase
MAFWGSHYASLIRHLDQSAPKQIVFDVVHSPNTDAFLDEISAPSSFRPNTDLGVALTEAGDKMILVGGGPDSAPSREILLDESVASRIASAQLTYAEDGLVRTQRRSYRDVPSVVGRLTQEAPEEFIIDYAKEQWPRLEALDVATGRFDPTICKGATVFVGVQGDLLGDWHFVPLLGAIGGVEVHAQAAATVLEHRVPVRAIPSWFAALLLSVATSATLFGRPWCLGMAPLIVIAWLGMAASLQVFGNILIPAALPALAGVLTTSVGWILRGVDEAAQKRAVNRLFGVNVSEPIRDYVLSTPTSLMGDSHLATVLFFDLRGSTTAAEGKDPRETFAELDRFFEVAGQEIANHNGVINRFLGDGFLALFGLPMPCETHADDAFSAALATISRIRELNRERCLADLPPFLFGIGIHTGPVAHGLLGAEGRKEYVVIGDTVNTASRVEGLTKELGAPLALTQSTYERLSSPPRMRRTDGVSVKGRLGELTIYSWSPQE